MKIAALIDPLEQLKPEKDTTLALLKSAQNLGWGCHFFTAENIYCELGHAYAEMSSIHLNDLNKANWAEVTFLGETPLSSFDIILMRKDPPFDLEYIYATYALELAEKQGVLVSNKPQSLRDANEKFFTLNFPQCCPPTLVCRSARRLTNFWKNYKQVIFKPLTGMGGNSVFYVDQEAKNLPVILEVLTQGQTVNIMAQEFIPEIRVSGDKRILVINGKPIPYALARIPTEGDIRGNLAAGAEGRVVPLTDRDKWLCDQISTTLIDKGLDFVGVDVIGNYITEINVTSPTCLQEIAIETGIDIAGEYLSCLSSQVHKKN